jgi:hypothetical protein
VEQEDYDEPPLSAVGRCAANVRGLLEAA